MAQRTGVYRCSCCGLTASGENEAVISCCGLTLEGTKDMGVRCQVNESRSSESNTEIVAMVRDGPASLPPPEWMPWSAKLDSSLPEEMEPQTYIAYRQRAGGVVHTDRPDKIDWTSGGDPSNTLSRGDRSHSMR
jgi:hypothetical protein